MDGGALEFILSRFIIKLEGIIGTIDETTSLMNNTEKNIAQACSAPTNTSPHPSSKRRILLE